MATLRHLSAIRTRLLTDPNLVSILSKDSNGNPAVHLSHIFDTIEPTYPLITLQQSDGDAPPWGQVPGGTLYGGLELLECQVMIESFSRFSVDQVSLIDDYIFALLHKREGFISTANATFKECRRNWNKSGTWDGSANFWRSASRYVVKVFLH